MSPVGGRRCQILSPPAVTIDGCRCRDSEKESIVKTFIVLATLAVALVLGGAPAAQAAPGPTNSSGGAGCKTDCMPKPQCNKKKKNCPCKKKCHGGHGHRTQAVAGARAAHVGSRSVVVAHA